MPVGDRDYSYAGLRLGHSYMCQGYWNGSICSGQCMGAPQGPLWDLHGPLLEESTGVVVEPTKPEPITAASILDEAQKQMVQRGQLRDQPSGERSMEKIIATFNALTGHKLTEAEGWEFMILLKLVRGRQGKFNKDDYVDAGAYSGLLGECEAKRER
jgi:hypothetical protein